MRISAAIARTGLVCALVVPNASCGSGSSQSSPSTPTPAPTPQSLGTFAIACGTGQLDLTWSGADTRACTVTSASGFDGDVALSCSGVPGATCEFSPATVRPAPDRPATSTLKVTYSEATSFGRFDATVRGAATVGTTIANATLSVHRDSDSITRHCPSAADVDAVDSALILDFHHDPTAGTLVCFAANGSKDLSYFRATVYKGLTVIRRVEFNVSLPWASGTAWQWLITSIRGLHFLDQNFGSCCGPDRMILFPTINAAAHPEQVIFTKLDDLQAVTTLVMHEARHANGDSYPHCAGNKDRSIAYLGGIGVGSYFYNRLLADNSPPGFISAQSKLGLTNIARQACNNSFCEAQACSF